MNKDNYPYGMEVLTRKKTIKKGDWTYTILAGEKKSSERILIDNHRTKKDGVCVPLSAIKELLNKGYYE